MVLATVRLNLIFEWDEGKNILNKKSMGFPLKQLLMYLKIKIT